MVPGSTKNKCLYRSVQVHAVKMNISFYEYWYKYLYLTTDRVHKKRVTGHGTWDKLQQLTCV